MFRWLSVFLLVLSLTPVLAQSSRIDSLRAVLAKHPQPDTFRVNQLNDLSNALRYREKGYDSLRIQQGDSALAIALQLARRLHYTYGQALTLYHLALNKARTTPQQSRVLLDQAMILARQCKAKSLQLDIIEFLGNNQNIDPKNALYHLRQGLVLAKAWQMQTYVVDFYSGIAMFYSGEDNYPQALIWHFQALKEAQQMHDKSRQSSALLFISTTYVSLTDYNQALNYALKGCQVARQSSSKDAQQVTIYNLAYCYLAMGRYPQAIAAYQQVLQDTSLYFYRRLYSLANMARAYERSNNLPMAFRYAFQALDLANHSQSSYTLYIPFLTLGYAYGKTHQLDSAIYYGQKSLQIAQQRHDKQFIRDASELLARVYAQLHKYAQAYTYQSQYLVYRDSLNNEEVTRKATAAQFNDQMSRQQSQIALLNKDKKLQAEEVRRQRLLFYTSLVVLLLIGSLLTLLYRNNRQKQRSNVLLQQQKVEIETQRDQTQQALTELKNTQTQLVQKEKMASLGELTAGIAHEIQNPLNFVNNFSEVSAEMVEELAQEQQSPQPNPALQTELLTDLKDNLHKILHHGQRASNIVKGMLEHSRNSTGDRQPTDLNALADEYLRLAYQGYRAKDKNFNADLKTDFAPDLGKVEVVPQELGRVLLNLYNNAFYAVQQKNLQGLKDLTGLDGYQPTVTVSTKRQNGQVEIRVRDNGTGIPESVKAKIFQPFFTTKPTGEGTGLGLSLSYDIIAKGHGGSLTVESQPGQGTEFTIGLNAPNLPAFDSNGTERLS